MSDRCSKVAEVLEANWLFGLLLIDAAASRGKRGHTTPTTPENNEGSCAGGSTTLIFKVRGTCACSLSSPDRNNDATEEEWDEEEVKESEHDCQSEDDELNGPISGCDMAHQGSDASSIREWRVRAVVKQNVYAHN